MAEAMSKTTVAKPSVSLPATDLQKMPPSSVHQANVGVPGGLNPRMATNLPRLPQTIDINNPSYRTQGKIVFFQV